MADILFSHSYFLRFDPKEFRAMMPYPPLGTLYAASVAREAGYSVSLFDSILAGSEDEIVDAIRNERPRVVVIYDDDFNFLTKMCLTRMRQAAFRMAWLAKQEGCIVIAHGSDPVDHLDEYLSHGADYVICGEGEQTLAETLDTLFSRKPAIESVSGLAYIQDGHTHRTPKRNPLKELDALPFPARDLMNVDRYRRLWLNRHGYFSINMVTTRGCPFHCNWCAKPIYGQVYNTRSAENVVEEMIRIKQTIHPDHIWFCDDIFGLKPGWLESFADLVVKKNTAIPFKCLARVDLLLKDNAITHLQRAGCVSVWVGAESGSQRILDAMEKGTTVEQIHSACRLLKQAGIGVGFFLQYGYPGETIEDIELTLQMVRDCGPDEIGVSISYPLPGTGFYNAVKQQLQEKHNWIDSQDLDMMFAGTYGREFYRRLHRVTHNKFRVWRGLDVLRNIPAHPWHVEARDMKKVLSGMYHFLASSTKTPKEIYHFQGE